MSKDKNRKIADSQNDNKIYGNKFFQNISPGGLQHFPIGV